MENWLQGLGLVIYFGGLLLLILGILISSLFRRREPPDLGYRILRK
jgi:hypothetical protein